MKSSAVVSEIKGVIFDLDGTLLNTLDDIAEAMNFALNRMGLATHPVDDYRLFIGEGVDMLVRRAVAPVTDEKIIGRCRDEFQKRYSINWNRKTAPYESVESMLNELEASRVFLAVLSNKPHAMTTEIIRYFFAERHFTVCIGNGIFPRKPDPSAALYIASVMGVNPSDCLYVGDSGTDIDTANAAGMPSVGVLWGFRGERELREKGACWIVERPEKIVRIVRNSCLKISDRNNPNY